MQQEIAVTPWSYESQLLLLLVVTALVGALGWYVYYAIRTQLRRRARRRSRERRVSARAPEGEPVQPH